MYAHLTQQLCVWDHFIFLLFPSFSLFFAPPSPRLSHLHLLSPLKTLDSKMKNFPLFAVFALLALAVVLCVDLQWQKPPDPNLDRYGKYYEIRRIINISNQQYFAYQWYSPHIPNEEQNLALWPGRYVSAPWLEPLIEGFSSDFLGRETEPL